MLPSLVVCIQTSLAADHEQLPVWVLKLGTVQANIVHVCLSIYLFIYGSTVIVDLGRFFSFLIYTQSVGPSQGRYIHREHTKAEKRTYRHPCLECDSNPRSQCSIG
jgi:hypothetical protein